MLRPVLQGSEDPGAAPQPQGANLEWKKRGRKRKNPPNATRKMKTTKKKSPSVYIRQLVFVDYFKRAYTSYLAHISYI